ncbi:hypothetical protein BHE74_00049815, partial [Ensete ventricosum]
VNVSKIDRRSAMAVAADVVAGTLAVVLAVALLSPRLVSSNSEGDALYALRKSLSDPDNVLQSWDPTLVNPCTWFHITCNQDSRVTRVRQVTGTRTDRYRAVPPKIDHRRSISAVGGRLKKKSTVGGRLREKSTVGGRLRKKKGRRRRGKEEKKKRRIPRRVLSPLADARGRFFSRARRRSVSLRGEKDRGDFGNLKSLISLDLYNNNISGVIPPTLGKLKSLVFL